MTAYDIRISDWSSDVLLFRSLPPLLFWSLFYMTWNTLKGEQYGPWYDWLRTLAQGPVVFHLWYLYAIVGIYLFVPFLRAIWNAEQPTETIAYLALCAMASAWPTIGTAMSIDACLLQVYSSEEQMSELQSITRT